MALKDILPALEEKVVFANGEFSVRGLSLFDVTQIMTFHQETLRDIGENFVAFNEGDIRLLNPGLGADFTTALIRFSPTIAAHIIAQAEVRPDDEPPAFAVAIKLPFDVQVDALNKIIKLTFQTEGGAKKVMETVAAAFTGIVKLRVDLAT